MTNLRVLIVHQAVSADSPLDELDVLEEVREVRLALKSLGHHVSVLPMTGKLEEMLRSLRRRRPDCVFNLVESLLGFGGLGTVATALFDAAQIPYTGNGTAALALTTDKVATKRALRLAGVKTPGWVTTQDHDSFRAGPHVFKPIAEDASVGLDANCLQQVRSIAQCRREIAHRNQRLERAVFAERFVEGREFNVSLYGAGSSPKTLPVAELRFDGYRERNLPTLYGYRAKWDKDSFEYRNTTREFNAVPADRELCRQVSQIAKKTWLALGCRGYARVDFRVDATSEPYVLEVNANPCLAADGSFYSAARHARLDFPQLISDILKTAVAD